MALVMDLHRERGIQRAAEHLAHGRDGLLNGCDLQRAEIAMALVLGLGHFHTLKRAAKAVQGDVDGAAFDVELVVCVLPLNPRSCSGVGASALHVALCQLTLVSVDLT